MLRGWGAKKDYQAIGIFLNGDQKNILGEIQSWKKRRAKNKKKKNKLKGRGSRCILICFATYCRLSLYIMQVGS
jgi:hypothetical protein